MYRDQCNSVGTADNVFYFVNKFSEEKKLSSSWLMYRFTRNGTGASVEQSIDGYILLVPKLKIQRRGIFFRFFNSGNIGIWLKYIFPTSEEMTQK